MPSPDLILDFARAKRLDPRISFGRNSIGTHYARDGLMKTAAINTPRIEHDPLTGRCLGLLVEESRTNLLTYSEQFDNTLGWERSDESYSANSTIAPNGQTVADTITAGSSATNPMHTAIALTDNVSYGVSVFLNRESSLAFERFRISTAAGSVSAYLNVSSLAWSSVPTPYSAGVVQSLSNTWMRLGVIYTPATGAGGSRRLSLSAVTQSGGTVPDTGKTAILFGSQVEIGPPTSYILTTSAAATREADTASMPLGSWYSSLGGTILCSFQAPIGITVGTHTLYDLHDGSANNRILLQTVDGALQAIVTAGGVEQCNLALGTLTALTDYNVAFAFKANDFSASLNAATCVTDTSGTIPTVTTLALGHDHTPANWLNGSLGRLLYFASRLPDSTLRELSR